MSFNDYSIWLNLIVFISSAGAAWFFGVKLTFYMDAISKKTGLGHAMVGMLFLGGITSLPELAVVITASLNDNVPLAINNMVGSIAINLVILAFADIVIGKDALTSVVAHPSTLLQGTFNILLLTLVAMAGLVGGFTFLKASLWSWFLLPTFVLLMWFSGRYRNRSPWVVPEKQGPGEGEKHKEHKSSSEEESKTIEISTSRLVNFTVVTGICIMVAGYLLAQTADALAVQTGIGANLIGFVLLSFVTGLPEISSVYGAVRKGHYEMAVGDIFGTNMWNVAIIAFADFVYQKGSVMGMLGNFEIVAALLAVLLTAVFVVGLLERRDKTIARMGYDSLTVIVLYGIGVVLLYFVNAKASGGS